MSDAKKTTIAKTTLRRAQPVIDLKKLPATMHAPFILTATIQSLWSRP
jgi:hypothetical protein